MMCKTSFSLLANLFVRKEQVCICDCTRVNVKLSKKETVDSQSGFCFFARFDFRGYATCSELESQRRGTVEYV